jgi:hypothetical protein
MRNRLPPPRRHTWNRRRVAENPAPPATGVHVVSVVSLHDGSGYQWTFDTDIESATTSQAIGYDVDGGDPGDAGGPGSNYRNLYYGFDDVGLPWSIVGTPTDIVFVGGLLILPGQSGVTSG